MEMITAVNIIGISWLIVNLNDIIDKINNIKKTNIKDTIKLLSTCFKCVSFWVTMILTRGDIGVASCISLLCFIIDKYLIKTEIEL